MAKRTDGITFNITKPGKERSSFAVNSRLRHPDGSSDYKTIRDERIDSVNTNYKSGNIKFEQALAQIKAVVKDLYRQHGREYASVVFNSDNAELLSKYWKSEYEHRDLVDVASARNDFRRAIEAAGPVPLTSASRQELATQISRTCEGTNKQRRVVARLNQLLKFANREFTLQQKKPEFPTVRYITWEGLQVVLGHLEETAAHAALVAFSTGCRIGEQLALESTSSRGAHLHISRQMRRDLSMRAPKNRKTRNAYIVPDGRDAVSRWVRIPLKEKQELRNRRWSEILQRAARESWPDEERTLTWHDLRHSYAIHLLNQGLSISQVAQLLGDSVAVCQQYYTGFSMTEEGIQSIVRSLG